MRRKSIFAAVGVIWLLFASAPFSNPDRVTPLTDPALLALITNDDSFAVADLTALIDPTQTSTQHYGPYASGSPDSGTCGNDWATDRRSRCSTTR